MTRSRAIGSAVVALAALALALVVSPEFRPARDTPTVVGVVVLAVLVGAWPNTRWWIGPAAASVVVATAAGVASWLPNPTIGGGIWSLELTAVLMVLLALLCRWSPPAWVVAVAPAGVFVESTLILQTTGAPVMTGWEAVGACVFWSLAGLVGTGSGLYLRQLDGRRAAAVTNARRVQRVRLAADLHDGVAHDVSAMVLQAQAAKVLLGERAGDVASVLDRIEADGTRALASMQRSIHVLREGEADRPIPQPELPVVQRVIAEALRNAEKHGDGGGVTLVITNPLPSTRRPRGPGLRYGLAGLADEVEAAGGTFSAGPDGDRWTVRLELPS
ncbi:sensor histidine kinase [Cryptosporangium arvum]|uniref:Histidine kinase n=1 Tax=Cryptosporangium arvum DSM 44712 TaxID=927661 RepID=A0A010ZQ78_9ACTN|nr:histidine kinase [Cryptosporangium arvum]EXG80814.1 Histidine kinase [Cryptosporangium arvum DSM 44712]